MNLMQICENLNGFGIYVVHELEKFFSSLVIIFTGLEIAAVCRILRQN